MSSGTHLQATAIDAWQVGYMVRMIMELVSNRSFPLTTGNNKWSRLRRLNQSHRHGGAFGGLSPQTRLKTPQIET